MLLKSFVCVEEDHSHSQTQLQDLLSCLQGERLKIDAFKRELPLCMHLLNNGNYPFVSAIFVLSFSIREMFM